MDSTKYTKRRLMASKALGVSRDVVWAALPEGQYTLEEAQKLIQKFLKRKVRD